MNAKENWITIFKAGDYRAQGKGIWTTEKLDMVVKNYDPAYGEAPLTIGHPKSDSPAFGWVEELRRAGDYLQARFRDVDSHFREWWNDRKANKLSSAFYNDLEGKGPYLRHVGALGGMPPGVKGLPQASFSAGDDGCVEFTMNTAASFAFQDAEELTKKEVSEVIDALIYSTDVPGGGSAQESVVGQTLLKMPLFIEALRKAEVTEEEFAASLNLFIKGYKETDDIEAAIKRIKNRKEIEAKYGELARYVPEFSDVATKYYRDNEDVFKKKSVSEATFLKYAGTPILRAKIVSLSGNETAIFSDYYDANKAMFEKREVSKGEFLVSERFLLLKKHICEHVVRRALDNNRTFFGDELYGGAYLDLGTNEAMDKELLERWDSTKSAEFADMLRKQPEHKERLMSNLCLATEKNQTAVGREKRQKVEFDDAAVSNTFNANKMILENAGIDSKTFSDNRREFPNLLSGNRGLGLLEVVEFSDKMLDAFYMEHKEYLGMSREQFKKNPDVYKKTLRDGGVLGARGNKRASSEFSDEDYYERFKQYLGMTKEVFLKNPELYRDTLREAGADQ
ncbi:MAG: hypothetical protein BWY28_02635 [bacterium ADurb.Bin236]|nr:MAG: hypothetical protein BWY28_02635 [bacterium ADurb.Bin236]HPN94474.1 hypothetical protein [bacterium]